MIEIKKFLTKKNYQKAHKINKYIVIHYTANNGDTAKGNCNYFSKEYRGASANYFVDENEIYQCVKDKDIAWHVGAKKYFNNCRNENSIGVELCSRIGTDGNYYFKEETIQNAQKLVRYLMFKYQIPLENVVRHYDVTHKICPEPFVRDPEQWQKFRRGLIEMFDNEYDALDFLVEKGYITDKEYWLKTLDVVKNQKFLIIKFANAVISTASK